MFQDINVAERHILNHFTRWRIRVSMSAYIDGMCYICPQNGVLHRDVTRAAPPVPAMVIKGDAVITVTHKYIVDENFVATHHINAIAPAFATERFQILDRDSCGASAKDSVMVGIYNCNAIYQDIL